MGVGDRAGCLHTCPCQSRLKTYQRSHIKPTENAPYHHRGSPRLNSSLLTCWVHGFMRLSTYQYMSIHPIQLETRLVRPRNLFPVISSSTTALEGPGEA
ncbi:hypothetical protein AVEN_146681-1 [Araneus ventricosus]|uniref:Uncharacterized protein n=1 Tax=Araneus ventricosus TaxID=182803 RepID=A0A4Y2LFS5_ARAVE|nr:hypothetical protein AVEN_146681-1 [Araneus ventricosus]